jgi:hypothetical protein
MLRALDATGVDELDGRHVVGPRYSFAVSDEKNREVEAAFRTGHIPRPSPDSRKFLLFVAACYRRIESLLIPEARRLLELHELDADGQPHPRQEAIVRKKLNAAARRPIPGARPGRAEAYAAASEAVRWLLRGTHDTAWEYVLDAIDEVVARDPEYAGGPDGEGPHQAALLRDIFGTPYAPPQFNPVWRTGNVLALARQMYESRDFSAMPILADALQDAGCDSDNILIHCRCEEPHVLGCCVVDLVLGKSYVSQLGCAEAVTLTGRYCFGIGNGNNPPPGFVPVLGMPGRSLSSSLCSKSLPTSLAAS